MGNFKGCPNCKQQWDSQQTFLNDQALEIVGYQVNFKDLRSGLFLFNHSCGSTLALGVDTFQNLYDGEIYQERATGTDNCPGLCLHEHELGVCPTHCECAYVREIIQIIKNWPKGERRLEQA